MLSVKVSPKFQVVIPKEIRESLRIFPGQRMQVVQYENRIELILEKDISELEGFLKGINTTFDREEDRL
jgi:AbrB family looped-hinge helix DNA binding protein